MCQGHQLSHQYASEEISHPVYLYSTLKTTRVDQSALQVKVNGTTKQLKLAKKDKNGSKKGKNQNQNLSTNENQKYIL